MMESYNPFEVNPSHPTSARMYLFAGIVLADSECGKVLVVKQNKILRYVAEIAVLTNEASDKPAHRVAPTHKARRFYSSL